MDKPAGLECIAWSWGIATLVGVFAAGGLWALGGWSFMQGAFMGVLVLLILGALLAITMCRTSSAPVEPGSAGVTPGGATTRAPAPKAAPAATATAPATSAPASPVPAPADPVPTGSGDGTRPEALDGPRGGTADDLKRIKGIGPKLEKLCNSLGFYHFDQIANWTADEVAWVDQNLEGFKGRVSRDEWVSQARLLAAGGETDFSKKVDDGDVY